MKEYYYDGRAKRKQKTDEEYYQDLEAFAEGKKIERVIVDPSAASLGSAYTDTESSLFGMLITLY